MCRWFPKLAEVIDARDETRSEVMLPEPIDDDARAERVCR